MSPSTSRTYRSTPCLAWRCDQEKDSRAPQGTSCGMVNDMTFDARRAIFVQIIPSMIIDDCRCIMICFDVSSLYGCPHSDDIMMNKAIGVRPQGVRFDS